jgi:hypothetical protein
MSLKALCKKGNRMIMFHPAFQGDTDQVLRRQQMTTEILRSMHTSRGFPRSFILVSFPGVCSLL